jgi:rhodanese-related sulfurtransferase
MKSVLLCWLALTLCALADGEKFPSLKVNGKEYTDVIVQAVEPDSLKVMHSAGIAHIPYEDLPDEVKKLFVFDPAKAKKIREEKAKRAADELEKQELEKTIHETAIHMAGKVSQVVENGVLLKNVVYKLNQKQEVTKEEEVVVGLPNGLHPDQGRATATRTTKEWKNVEGHFGDSWIFVSCDSTNYVDGQTYAGTVWADGTYNYQAVSGARKTVKAFRDQPLVPSKRQKR